MSHRPDSDQIKAELAAVIIRLVAQRALTDAAASEQIGMQQPASRSFGMARSAAYLLIV
jgi:predicted XRE-type DNA-binding protein